MLVHVLSDAECREILERAELARLACSRYDHPYVVPVYLSFDADSLYGFSTVGQKITWMRENPNVCVEIEDVSDRSHWTTVVVFGRYEEITDAPADREARERAHRCLERRPGFWLPGVAKVPSAEHATPVLYRIRIDRVTGRRAARPA